MKRLLMLMLGIAMAGNIVAETQTRTVDYVVDGLNCRGLVAFDDAAAGKRPGVLVIPEWWGMNDYATSRAKMLAELGYVAFVADMYGEGRSTTDPKEAGKWAGEVRGDRLLMRARAEAALAQLKAQPEVRSDQVAAIGYCFGGTGVLELARSNADVRGVVSFHGGLKPGDAASSETIRPKVLVLHGAADPHVTDEQLAAFMDEMDAAKADWYLVAYGHAVHGFTNPAGGNDPSKGVAYNEKADKRSWQEMQDFFRELFGK